LYEARFKTSCSRYQENVMSEFSRILCPVDFSEFSVRALHYAVSLAQHYRAKLFVQHVVELWRYPSAGFSPGKYFDEFSQRLLQKGEEKLQELLRTATDTEIQPEPVVQQGTAADSILAFATSRKTDLIVMGTHGRRGFDRLMLGSVTERVIRKAPCPVLAVRKPAHDFVVSGKQQDTVHLSRILFCTDFSENSQRAMDHAISLTEEYNAELTVLHVLEDVPDSARMADVIAPTTERLKKLLPLEVLKPERIKTIVRIGTPYREIIQFTVEAQTDMVVMAVRGRSALDLAVFGATTHRVMQLGPCPVLAVHV